METIRSPFESIFNIIDGLPQGHEKPLKHALYNALAILLLALCCAAGWALYIILDPFIKPLIWAVLVGSVLHPLKYSLATKLRSWFIQLEESDTSVFLGLVILPINIANDLSEFIGSKLRKHVKLIITLVILVPVSHILYYYTPKICISVVVKTGSLIHYFVTGLLSISNTILIFLVLIAYVSVICLYWNTKSRKKFHYASLAIWFLISCYLAHLTGYFRVPVFIFLQIIFVAGFISELHDLQDEAKESGKNISLVETFQMALEGKPTDTSKSEEKGEQQNVKSTLVTEKLQDKGDAKDPFSLELFSAKSQVPESKSAEQQPITSPSTAIPSSQSDTKLKSLLKPQRSLSQPSPLGRIGIFPRSSLQNRYYVSLKRKFISQPSNDDDNESEQLASDFYMHTLYWACAVMVFWKHISLLPILPIPIIIYVVKHLGYYLGFWSWLGGHINAILKSVKNWCNQRIDAFVPLPVRGVYKILVKLNIVIRNNLKDSIDTVSSIVVIFSLIIFVICASVFIVVQVYAEAIMLIQVGSNVINNTIVHNPELRQVLPPGWEDTVDSLLDNAYVYGRDGISKLVRGMMSDQVDVAKSEKLEKQVLELWDRVYQAWMTSDDQNGPKVTPDAVQNSWNTFLDDIQKSPEVFNVNGIIDFTKQNVGTLMTLLESIWVLLKGNISLVLGSFSAFISVLLGGGTAVLNFILSVIVFLTTLFYLLSSSGALYKPVDLITNFSPYNGHRFGLAFEGAINGVFKASFKMAIFYGLWTWFIHSLFGVKIVYLPSALATVLGAVPFLGPYWACIPAVLDLWLAQERGLMAILLAVCQLLPSSVVDTTIYMEIKGGGHPYLTGLAIAGGIFCLGVEGAIIGPLLLCGLYVAVDLSSSIFKETPNEENIPMHMQHISRLDRMLNE